MYTNSNPGAIAFLRLPQVLALVGISRSLWYAWQKEGGRSYDPDCPKAVKIGAKSVGWVSSEVEEYIEKKIKKSRQ